MIEIPKWILKRLDSWPCQECSSMFSVTGLIGISIRYVEQKEKTCLFIEYICPKCQVQFTIEIIPMTVEEFVGEMMNEYISGGEKKAVKNTKRKKRQAKSKITDEEILEGKRIMEESDSFMDVLVQFGVDPDVLQKYGTYNGDSLEAQEEN